jgi:hypothetical protein
MESERKRNYDEETSEQEVKERKRTANDRRYGKSVDLKRNVQVK